MVMHDCEVWALAATVCNWLAVLAAVLAFEPAITEMIRRWLVRR